VLISVDTYREITGDASSASAVVETAVQGAQRLLEEQLQRGLELEERTERMRVFPDGRVYPRCTPLVTGPSGSTISGSSLLGAGPAGSFVEPDDRTAVTYTGGFDPDEEDRSAVTFVPVELQRAVAWGARAIITPGDGLEVPSGATSVTVGDVSVSWGPGGSPATGEITFPRPLVRRYRFRSDMAA
jgi:hypothetical protein